MDEPTILRNRIRTPDGTILESRHRHDYRTYVDANGLEYMVDGGLSYLRRTVHPDAPYEELTLYANEDHEKLRAEVVWGAIVDHNTQYLPIKQMSKAHINAILDDGYKGPIVELMKREVLYREETESLSEAKRMEIQREASYG